MPQTPSGGGSIVPPASAWPWKMMSMNALRSSANAIALRSSRLSNGGFSRLMIRLVLTLIGAISQIAVGSCVLMSFISAAVISVGKVMSTLPATKASTAVARLLMIVYSMPSRYGRPFFQ